MIRKIIFQYLSCDVITLYIIIIFLTLHIHMVLSPTFNDIKNDCFQSDF